MNNIYLEPMRRTNDFEDSSNGKHVNPMGWSVNRTRSWEFRMGGKGDAGIPGTEFFFQVPAGTHPSGVGVQGGAKIGVRKI